MVENDRRVVLTSGYIIEGKQQENFCQACTSPPVFRSDAILEFHTMPTLRHVPVMSTCMLVGMCASLERVTWPQFL